MYNFENIERFYEENRTVLLEGEFRPGKSWVKDPLTCFDKFKTYRDYCATHGNSLTKRELGEMVGLEETNTLEQNIHTLVDFGFLEQDENGKFRFTVIYDNYLESGVNAYSYILEKLYTVSSLKTITRYLNYLICTLREAYLEGSVITFQYTYEEFARDVTDPDKRNKYYDRAKRIYNYEGRRGSSENYSPNITYMAVGPLKNLGLLQDDGRTEEGMKTTRLTVNGYHFLIELNKKLGLQLVESSNPSSQTQVVYFGAPGTGKSHKVKHEVIPEGVEPYRVTFYPDYYYSDFVGGLRPKQGRNGIDYKFEAGPFAKALRDSFIRPTYLIIEEINRGNAAAIFGDVFQLLDRKDGKSEYSITNHELYEYLVDEGVTILEKDKVFLPSNLIILCTMNTADQNVFVLDTAFKRRFKMVYVPIDFNAYYIDGDVSHGVKESCKGYIDNTGIFNGEGYDGNLKNVMTQELYDSVKKIINEPIRDWRTFAAYINAKIDSINAVEQKISEDKKLGPFFVDPVELESRQAFADKVLYYLKQDVFKYEDNILTDSYEVLYEDFVTNMKDIFELFHNPR